MSLVLIYYMIPASNNSGKNDNTGIIDSRNIKWEFFLLSSLYHQADDNEAANSKSKYLKFNEHYCLK